MFRILLFILPCATAITLSSTSLLLYADQEESDQSRLAEGIDKWELVKKECGGNYSYTVRWSSAFGFGHVTEIIVRKNEVIERRFESFDHVPPATKTGAVSKRVRDRWGEEGDAIGSHRLGAPPKTLDELYAEAEKVAARELEPHERRYLRFDKRGLPISCFYVDTRIADDTPAIGLRISAIQLSELPEDAAALAKTAVSKFARALKQEDVTSIGEILGVPYYDGGNKIFTDKSLLTEWYKNQIAEKEFEEIDFEIGQITSFEKIERQLSGATGKLIRQVLTKGDQLAHLTILFASGKKDEQLVFVRIRDGNVSIVGLRDLR